MTRATVTPFALRLRAPLTTARGRITSRTGAVFGVDAGAGEATPLPGWTESLPATHRALADARHALERGGWPAAVRATAGAPAARHAVTLARDDRRARRASAPLSRHLGGDRTRSVPVNATVGDAPPAVTARRAAEHADAGFDCVKVKVGGRGLAVDRQRLRAVREQVGEGVTLRADANGAWDRETAARAVDALADLGVALIEQPLPPGDLAGHAALRGRGVAIALDESVANVGVDRVLAADGADAVVLKPMALGGVDRAVAAARRARAAGATPIVTTTIDGVIARTAAVHVAAAIGDPPACGLATADRLATDLAADPAPVADGRVQVPQSGGTGVDLAEVGG